MSKKWNLKIAALISSALVISSISPLTLNAESPEASSNVTGSPSGVTMEHLHSGGPTSLTTDLPSIDDIRKDFSLLYKDLAAIPYFAGGGVAAIGGNAFNVSVPGNIPAIAASRYGKGRVLLAGSDRYFNLSEQADETSSTLARNILLWLTDESHTNSGRGNDITGRYADALRETGKKISLITTSHSFTVSPDLPIELVKSDSWESANLNPQKYAVAYVDSAVKDSDLEALDKYIRLGGSVIVSENNSVLEGITRDTPEHIVLQVGNLRGGRLSRDFAIQKLMNRAGLTLMNRGTDSNGNESKLTPEQSLNHHFMNRFQQGRAVEAGTITYDDIDIGPAGTTESKKRELLYTILSETLETLSTESQLFDWASLEASKLPSATFPISKFQAPYTNALRVFEFSHFTLNPSNKKSPYADQFPGKVADDAFVVNNREVEVDFDFPNMMYTHALPSKNWVSTGLYAPPGKAVTLEVPEGAEHLTVQIGSHDDDLRGASKWERAPLVVNHQKLAPGRNQVNSPYGGLIYLIPLKSKPGVKVKVSISGAVEAPRFVLGETTAEQWEAIRNLPPSVPFAELQGKRIVLTVPSELIRDVSNPEELMQTWDEIYDSYDELVGLHSERAMPHTAHKMNRRYVADVQISSGAMHAGYPIMLPFSYAPNLLDIDYLRSSAWGFWHELGHEYQQRTWTWGDVGEVTVNIFSLYTQERYGNPSELLKVGSDGQDYYDRAISFASSDDPDKKYGSIGNYERLVMFKQLQLSYGWDLYTRIFEAYREMPQSDIQNTVDTFALVASREAGEDLTQFFSQWAIGLTDQGKDKIKALQLPQPQQEMWLLRE
ncbi:M60 family metallopeptidase [Paenibacillus lactis]|uniref:M60 family metallopeptidase n=1 Tax=Paenibacillus lactis TaxID=228574 RepID=UPI001FD3423A|nr:M60 family metallopeptidase [Paenibacillus lactis]MCM3492510.1 M60 family metallopeptidase [Paenibacillus lactis]